MPRRPPPYPLVDLIDTLLDAAEDSLYRLLGNLAQPQPPSPSPGPRHKRAPATPPPPTSQRSTPRPKTPPRPPKPPSRPSPPPISLPDHYSTLEISPTASQTVIQASYRALARIHHPDVCPGQKGKEKAVEKMGRINGAYEVLRDPVRRSAYDYELRRQRRQQQ